MSFYAVSTCIGDNSWRVHSDHQGERRLTQSGGKEERQDLLEWQVVGEEPTAPRTAGLHWVVNSLLAMVATPPAPQLQGCGHGHGKRFRLRSFSLQDDGFSSQSTLGSDGFV